MFVRFAEATIIHQSLLHSRWYMYMYMVYTVHVYAAQSLGTCRAQFVLG